MTSHNRRWVGQLRRQACSGQDLPRIARDHLPGSGDAASFEFTFAGPLHLVLPVVGQLRVETDAIEVHYGPWWFRTPLSNLATVSTHQGHVLLTFRDGVHGHEPVGVRHHELALTVDDPDRVTRCLRRVSGEPTSDPFKTTAAPARSIPNMNNRPDLTGIADTVDQAALETFSNNHARVLDRHRLRPLLGDGDEQATLAALLAYRNPDGGFGNGLEPDLRAAESQPAAALHAFEVFAELATFPSDHAVRLCDWLAEVSLADGGLPFALPVGNPAGCAPFWLGADATVSSPQISAIVAANARRVATNHPGVAAHPWLARVTEYCVSAIRAMRGRTPHAIELAFAVRFVDELHSEAPELAEKLLAQLAEHVPADGLVHVQGGAEAEFMRPLDFSPLPGTPSRELLSAEAVAADLRRLAGGQQDDGGWQVDFVSYSPAARLEWRGYATVQAVRILRGNGLLPKLPTPGEPTV